MSKPSHHAVLFLCNEDHGLPTGYVEQIEIADEIRIVCQKPRPPVFRVASSKRRVKVGMYHYDCLGWSTWVGNIFWDGVTMHVAEARRLVRNLLANGWSVEEHAEGGPFAHLVRKTP